MVDSWTYLRGDKKLFALLCGQNFDLDRKDGAGGPTAA